MAAPDLFFELHGITVRVGCDLPDVHGELERFLEHLGLTPCAQGRADIVIELAAGDPDAVAEGEGWASSPLAGYSVLTQGNRLEVKNERARIRICPDEGKASGVVAAVGERLHMNLVSHALLTLLRYHDLYPLHAAGAERDGAGVLIVADSGGGKSTLAAHLLLSGWKLVSDDSLLLRPSSAGIEALALRRDLFVLPDNAVLDGGVDHSRWPDPDKLRIDPRQRFPDRVAARCLPTLVVFPHIAGCATSRLEPCSDDEALHLLAHHGLVAELERGRAGRHMGVLAALVEQCRCHRLAAGRDLLDDPELASRLFSTP